MKFCKLCMHTRHVLSCPYLGRTSFAEVYAPQLVGPFSWETARRTGRKSIWEFELATVQKVDQFTWPCMIGQIRFFAGTSTNLCAGQVYRSTSGSAIKLCSWFVTSPHVSCFPNCIPSMQSFTWSLTKSFNWNLIGFDWWCASLRHELCRRTTAPILSYLRFTIMEPCKLGSMIGKCTVYNACHSFSHAMLQLTQHTVMKTAWPFLYDWQRATLVFQWIDTSVKLMIQRKV